MDISSSDNQFLKSIDSHDSFFKDKESNNLYGIVVGYIET